MKCFVIMPFDQPFNDVYATIQSVASRLTAKGQRVDCRRLDDIKAPGKISDDLLEELRGADLCLADLTSSNPNVMWEVGYAMALGKPVVTISQAVSDLPFDLKHHRTIEYQRSDLARTLSTSLEASLGQIYETIKRGSSAAPISLGESASAVELQRALLDYAGPINSQHSVEIINAKTKRGRSKIYDAVQDTIEAATKSLLCVTHHTCGPDPQGRHLDRYYDAIESKIGSRPDFEYRRVYQFQSREIEASAATIGERGYQHFELCRKRNRNAPGTNNISFFYRTALRIQASYLISDERRLFVGIPHLYEDTSAIRTLICIEGLNEITVRPFVEHFDRLVDSSVLLEPSEEGTGVIF